MFHARFYFCQVWSVCAVYQAGHQAKSIRKNCFSKRLSNALGKSMNLLCDISNPALLPLLLNLSYKIDSPCYSLSYRVSLSGAHPVTMDAF